MDNKTTVERADLYFEDGVRRIDYVLVWNEKDESNSSYGAVNKRGVFEENLEREGLQLERSQVADLRAIKLHVPLTVLQRTAEIMKLRVPLKDALVTDDGEGAVSGRLWRRFGFDLNVFPPKGRRCTEVYSAHKDHLFDGRHFNEWSTRTSIVDFVLKRASFDPQDEYAFGIERLLNEHIYSAAYPLHEGQSHLATLHPPQNLFEIFLLGRRF
jgi:anoctamin-1